MTDINQTTSITSITNSFKYNDTGITNLKEELEGLFASKNITMSDSELDKVNKQIEALEGRIRTLSKRVKTIEDDIEKKKEKIDETNGKLLVLINNINAGTREYKKYVDGAVLEATQAAANVTGRDPKRYTKQDFNSIFEENLRNAMSRIPGVQMAQIDEWYAEYEKLKNDNEFKDALSDLNDYNLELGKLRNQLKNTNGTINFLTATENSIKGTTVVKTAAYKNVDADTNIPIYSGKKQDIATDILLADYKTDSYSNVSANEIQQGYLDTFYVNGKKPELEPDASGQKDRYNYDVNPSLRALGDALNDGMFEKLQEAGMSSDEILSWINEKFDVGTNETFYKDQDGTWHIPFGHGERDENGKAHMDANSKAHEVYLLLAKKAETEKPDITANACNAESVSKLMDAVKNGNILSKMANNGFTFKEAMYVIQQTFGDKCGIEYDVNEQGDGVNYQIVGDTNATGTFFNDFAKQVKNIWGVEAGQATNKSSVKLDEKMTDPMTFQQGNSTYTFLAQGALEDKKFGGASELLGAQNGMDEWKAFDDDGNGKIEGDELKNVFLMKNTQTESSHDKGSISDTNTVDFSATFMSAADLGITEINYTELDTKNAGKKNINGSEIKSNFKIKTDGKNLEKDITAQQTLATDAYLNVFYNALASTENIAVKQTFANFSEEEIGNFFKDWYSMQVEYGGNDIGLRELDKNIAKLMDKLEDLIEKYTDKYGSSDRYELNIDFKDFKKWYSGNMDSLYIKSATEIAEKTGYAHRADDKLAGERDKAKKAVQDAIDNHVDEYGIVGLGKIDIKDGVTRKAVHEEGNEWLKKHENDEAVKKWAKETHVKIIKEEDANKKS